MHRHGPRAGVSAAERERFVGVFPPYNCFPSVFGEFEIRFNSSAQHQASVRSRLRLLHPTTSSVEGTGRMLVLPNLGGLRRARQTEPLDLSPEFIKVWDKTCSPRPQFPTSFLPFLDCFLLQKDG